MLLGRVGVDDQRHVVHVDSARGDVGGHERLDLAVRVRGQVAGAHHLGKISVELDGGNAGLHERCSQLPGAVLRAREDQGLAGGRTEVGDHVELVVLADMEEVVGHGDLFLVVGLDLVRHRVGQELAHDLVDAAVESRGEQHVLGSAGDLVQDLGDVLEEPELGHVVGFVKDDDLDVVEVDVAALQKVDEPTGTGNDDVSPVAHGLDLLAVPDAAVDHRGRHVESAGERTDDVTDLVRELARGHEDQRARPELARGAVVLGEAGDHRQREGERLAGTGAATAEGVLAGQCISDRQQLDREGGVDALTGEFGHDGHGQTKVSKSGLGVHDYFSLRRGRGWATDTGVYPWTHSKVPDKPTGQPVDNLARRRICRKKSVEGHLERTFGRRRGAFPRQFLHC